MANNVQFIPRALPFRINVGRLDNVSSQAEFKAMRKLNFQCQCCDFVALPSAEVLSGGLEFVEVHGKWFLLCLMCAQSQHLTRPILSPQNQKEFNHGRLVFCPGLSQGKIISIVRDIYTLQQYQTGKGNRALRNYADELRQGFIGHLIDSCTNLPNLKIQNNDLVGYAHLYKYASPELLKNESAVFGGIKYIPDEAYYSHVISYWLSTSYASHIEKLEQTHDKII